MNEQQEKGAKAPNGCIKHATQKPTTTTTIIMTTYTHLTILLLCLLLQYSTAAAPSKLRGADQIQLEDYIIMENEMAWGMKEMARYKYHRGEWPTRSTSSFEEEETQQPEQLAQPTQQSAEEEGETVTAQ